MIYVMQIHTDKTAYVALFLERWLLREGESVYAPTYEKEMTIRGEKRLVTKLLFPGYMFIQSGAVIDFYTRLKEVKMEGFLLTLTKLLGAEGEFIPLSDEEEKEFLSLTGEEHKAGMSYGIIADGRLQITSGPLAGREGDIVRIDRHKRTAILSMPFMGRRVKVRLGLEVAEKS